MTSPPFPTRTETDSFGPIEVPAGAMWGAQTERSRQLFVIGTQRMPMALVRAIAEVKRASALANLALGRLDAPRAEAIAAAAAQVAAGAHDADFPLGVWQTGSATQTHMNVNEVLANLASIAMGAGPGAARCVDPHEHVNLGQSSNDVVPTAMHLAAVRLLNPLWLALSRLRGALREQADRHADTVKLGRTHLQDAVPMRLGQEIGAWEAQLALAEGAIGQAAPGLLALAIGGTALGTGLNTPPAFGARVAALLAEQLGTPYHVADNRFAAIAGHEALVWLHSALRLLAVALVKIGNDLRLLASGPRAGLGELKLPANEPGSSMMPGKVNPTQIEALLMVCMQVMAHDVAVGLAAAGGQLELNACKPLIALDVLDSLTLLADAMTSFELHCVHGLGVDAARLNALLAQSLAGATALVPHIGHLRAARIAQRAHHDGVSLREAALAAGGLSAEQFDAWVDLAAMAGPR
jgi:fumarate hydratase, class II